MKHSGKYFFILILLLFAGKIHSQTDWKNILQNQKFTVSKDKNTIPKKIIEQLFDTITGVANPKENWDASCIVSGKLPGAKLNWTASYNGNWIVCYSTGGYSARTIYVLISPDTTEEISNSGRTGENFTKFKSKYISGTLKRGSSF